MIDQWTWDSEWGWMVLAAFALIGAVSIGSTLAINAPLGKRMGLLSLRLATLALLALCALDPRRLINEPTPGENTLVVAVDRSRSMQTRTSNNESSWTMAEEFVGDESSWLTEQASRFSVVQYALGERLDVHARGSQWPASGTLSRLFEQLGELQRRYAARPTAGLVLLTDGSATDLPDSLLQGPLSVPIYPVLLAPDDKRPNLTLREVKATPTLFEASPVIITAQLEHEGLPGERVVARVIDSQQREQAVERLALVDTGPSLVRLLVERWTGDVGTFVVEVRLESEEALASDASPESRERTLEDNSQRILVTRPTGPYRILYVAGRPSWEFKFLRRSVQDDDELSVLGLIRLANREPRFAFLEQGGRRNSFFDGFDSATDEETADYDEPVMVRIGTEDSSELMGGFPKSEAELFEYSALVIDDIEADFFGPDQLRLIRTFVERRGGGLLLLGGPRSFEAGAWRETTLAELSPVYLANQADVIGADSYRWQPTRDGWLATWTRLRDSEQGEMEVRQLLPSLLGINRVGSPKPAATVLATAGEGSPLLVTQNFGRGRTAALTASDLHRWHLLGEPESGSEGPLSDTRPLGDLGRQWRQLLRWLVSDLPRRIEILAFAPDETTSDRREVQVLVRGANYEPDDRALVQVDVRLPDGSVRSLSAVPSETAGVYKASVWMEAEGEFSVKATAVGEDGESIGEARSGWVWEPSREEIANRRVNLAAWQQIAERSGGAVLTAAQLRSDDWINWDKVPSVVVRSSSVWHEWPVLTLLVAMLVAEWWLRRRRGGV